MDRRIWAVFGALALAKLALLALFGPVMTPDSPSYSGMARTILASSSWLHDAGLTQAPMPAFAFRVIGYPAFLAIVIATAGPAWAYVTVLIQSAVSLFASWKSLEIGKELGLSRGLSLTAAALCATSLQLTLDQCILTDSLNASFIILSIAILVRGVRSRQVLKLRAALAAGTLLMLAFLFREFMQALIFLFLVLLAARIAIVGKDLRIRTTAAALLVVIPTLAAVQAYREWNAYRTGERFVTTGAQTALLLPLAKVAERKAGLLTADTPLDQTLRLNLKDYSFGDILRIQTVLFAQGYLATDIARIAAARYLTAWREHPLDMLVLLRAISESQTKLAVQPISATCQIIEWGNSKPRCYDYRALYRGILQNPMNSTAAEAALFLALTIQHALSIILFAAFLIGVPLFVLIMIYQKNKSEYSSAFLLAAFWAMYCGWDLAYVFIHFEDRYLASVIPLSVFSGIFIIQKLMRQNMRKSRAEIPELNAN